MAGAAPIDALPRCRDAVVAHYNAQFHSASLQSSRDDERTAAEQDEILAELEALEAELGRVIDSRATPQDHTALIMRLRARRAKVDAI